MRQQQQQQRKPARTIKEYLESADLKTALADIMPRHASPERMTRIAINTLTRVPKLARCEPYSFLQCLLDLSAWNLEPDGRKAHLIPFENRDRKVIECQLIIDYKGLVDVLYRHGHARKIHADVIREGDVFVYNKGNVEQHVPWFLRPNDDPDKPDKSGEIIAAYAEVELTTGAVACEVISREEINSIRKRSKAKSGPWNTDFGEMCKKSAFRRATKWLPLSPGLQEIINTGADTFEPIETTARPRRRRSDEVVGMLTERAEAATIVPQEEERETVPVKASREATERVETEPPVESFGDFPDDEGEPDYDRNPFAGDE